MNFVLFVDLHVGQGRFRGHVDHVKDLAEAVLHAQVVKNPDLVRFCEFKQRNSYNKSARQIGICLNYVLFVVQGLHVGQGSHGRHVDHVKMSYIMPKLSKIRIW